MSAAVAVPEIVVCALMLPTIDQLAERGRRRLAGCPRPRRATLSTALNSNALNITIGLLLPAAVIGLGRPDGQARWPARAPLAAGIRPWPRTGKRACPGTMAPVPGETGVPAARLVGQAALDPRPGADRHGRRRTLGARVVLVGLLIIEPCRVLLTGRWGPTGITGLWATGLAVVLGIPNRI